MAVKVIKRLLAIAGKKAQNKPVWRQAGVLMRSDSGKEFILLERSFNPAGCLVDDPESSFVILSLCDPEDYDTRMEHKIKKPEEFEEVDDDIPS